VVKAVLLFDERREISGGLLQGRIWSVPTPVPPSSHGLKYSLVFIVEGVRRVGYDNERGKGDHRHLADREEPYCFTSVEQLMADFLADVRRAGGQI